MSNISPKIQKTDYITGAGVKKSDYFTGTGVKKSNFINFWENTSKTRQQGVAGVFLKTRS
jgi:hypothetical protein